MSVQQDKNFDALIEQFAKRVYQTEKGNWRLKLLKEDLSPMTQTAPLTIWDAGCGFAQISLWLAQQGHELTLCDVSEKMLERAKHYFAQAECVAQFYQESAQTLADQLPLFDIVLCHAVLEWLAQPLPSLSRIAQQVKQGGYLSLLFYNRNALVYLNTLRGGWRWQNVLDDCYIGKGHKLSPPNPQYPHEVIAHLEQLGFKITVQTGIRVFYDYLPKSVLDETAHTQLFELEYKYCRLPTYRDMGRYIHLLAHRPE